MKKTQKYTHILTMVFVVGILTIASTAQAGTGIDKITLPAPTLPDLVNFVGDGGSNNTVDTKASTTTQGGGGSDMLSGLMDKMSKAISDSLPKGSIPATNCSPAGAPGFPTFGRDGTACSVPVSVGAVGGVCQGGQCNAVSFTSGKSALQSFKDDLLKKVTGGIAKKLLSTLFGGGGGGGGSYPDNYTAPTDTGGGGFDTLDTTQIGTNTGLDSIFTDSSSTSLTYTPLSLATGKKNISPKINVVTRISPSQLNTVNQTKYHTVNPNSSVETNTRNGEATTHTIQRINRTSPYRRADNSRTQIFNSTNMSRGGGSVTLSELTAGSIEAQRRASLLNERVGAESLNNLRDYRSSNIVDRSSNTGNNNQSQKSKPSFWERILQIIGSVFKL